MTSGVKLQGINALKITALNARLSPKLFGWQVKNRYGDNMTTLSFKTISTDGQELIHDTLRDNITKRECNLILDFGSSDVEKRIGYPIIEVGEFDYTATYSRLGARLYLPIICELAVHTRSGKELRTLCDKALEVLDINRLSFELNNNLFGYRFRAMKRLPERIDGSKYHSAAISLYYKWQSTTNSSVTKGTST